MSKEAIFSEPAKELILTMSAWRRLFNKAETMRRNEDDKGESLAGLFILSVMHEAWTEAQKDLKNGEKDLRKKMKEVKE